MKNFLKQITKLSIEHPWGVLAVASLITLLFLVQFPRIQVDTDPENMLEVEQADRAFYREVKDRFGIYDLIVVGIVDEEGVFRPEVLGPFAEAVEEIRRLDGVIAQDIVSLTTTDDIRSSGSVLEIRPAMTRVPENAEEIAELRRRIAANPFLAEKVAAADGTGLAVYIPIESKELSSRVAAQVEEIFARRLPPGPSIHIAGLPLAEDAFGHEMFLQMAVVAPLAFVFILVLVYLLFRQRAFLVPIALDAMFAVIWSLGLLILTGHTVHIMSSMIPVFLMPIAILDDIHILSEFFDRYREVGDKRKALMTAMEPLYRPMLMTSVTSAVGFASLTLAGIPPVRVFGLFVAFGIMVAWLLSMTVVPAVISLMGDRGLQREAAGADRRERRILDRGLAFFRYLAIDRWKGVLVASMAVAVLGLIGISRIQVNDNPVRWFQADHPIRQADRQLNQRFGGTYMAYLVLEGEGPEALKDPRTLRYVDRLQTALERHAEIGKTSSVADIVRRVYRVLKGGDEAHDIVPPTREEVGQMLFLFEMSGDPEDLDNFLTADGAAANMWIQMKEGDNRSMAAVEGFVDSFLAENPPPNDLRIRWSGLTYINRVWQNLMVGGMGRAMLGSFAVIFAFMCIEFRSLAFGLISMLPLSIAILVCYGLVGLLGQPYTMPIAVCSSLSLGLGIDFAVHYLERFRSHLADTGGWAGSIRHLFDEPGRAVLRNAIVISLGFLPLTLSTLGPYVTVGIFFALLMLGSSSATLLTLPAMLRLGERWLSAAGAEPAGMASEPVAVGSRERKEG